MTSSRDITALIIIVFALLALLNLASFFVASAGFFIPEVVVIALYAVIRGITSSIAVVEFAVGCASNARQMVVVVAKFTSCFVSANAGLAVIDIAQLSAGLGFII